MSNDDNWEWLFKEDSYSQQGGADGNQVNMEVAASYPLNIQVRQEEDGTFVPKVAPKEKPWTIPQAPHDLVWLEGPLPDVHSIPRNCSALVWIAHEFDEDGYNSLNCYNHGNLPPRHVMNGTLSRITVAFPQGDELNPLRWCDNSCMPIGYCERVAWYAWINKGNKDEHVTEASA